MVETNQGFNKLRAANLPRFVTGNPTQRMIAGRFIVLRAIHRLHGLHQQETLRIALTCQGVYPPLTRQEHISFTLPISIFGRKPVSMAYRDT